MAADDFPPALFYRSVGESLAVRGIMLESYHLKEQILPSVNRDPATIGLGADSKFLPRKTLDPTGATLIIEAKIGRSVSGVVVVKFRRNPMPKNDPVIPARWKRFAEFVASLPRYSRVRASRLSPCERFSDGWIRGADEGSATATRPQRLAAHDGHVHAQRQR
jgi:hypothetical protein